MSRKIKGIAKYQTIEGGFWSIISDDGEKLRPLMMPVQFQENNAHIECRVELYEEDFSFHMWGIAIKIVSFRTIDP
jgi:hypothetical protein